METTNNWDNQIASALTPITLNAVTHGVNVSTDALATTVNIAAGGAGNKTLTLGSTNTTSTTNIQSGSGGINIPAFTEGALVTSSAGRVTSVDGAVGTVLTANAPGVAPSFQPIGSGNRVLIQTQTVSGVTSCDFVTGVTGYAYYVLECLGYYFDNDDNQALAIFLSTNAGGSWNAFTYAQFIQSNESDFPVFRALGASSVTGPLINGFQGTTLHNIIAPGYGIMKLYGFAQAFVKQTTFSGADRSNDATSTEQLLGVSGTNLTTVVNGIRIAQDATPTLLFSGTFRLYGVV